MTTVPLDAVLPSVSGGPLRLRELLGARPAALVFVHADCPTSMLALRRLRAVESRSVRCVYVFQEAPDTAARLARANDLRGEVVSEPPPYTLAEACGVEAVPTAVLLRADGSVAERVVGWDRDRFGALLGATLPPDEPSTKPGCQARNTYDADLVASAASGLDDLEDMWERGWTDGLPVVPPTRDRVEAMLGGRDPTESLGFIPPALGEATVERVAACAVLAGCRPEYFPVVLAAVQAALEPAFNLNGQAVTTQPAGQIVLVNGPVRDAIGLNAGMGALGPGWRANLTIGRALRLAVALTGGGMPGRLDRSTLGQPGKLSFCLAENEEASPWEPFHVEHGFPREASVVTLVAADAPLSVSDHRSRTPDELAAALGWAAAATWSPNWWPLDTESLFVVCPEHAALFHAHGWEKKRVREAIFETVRKRADELRTYGETPPFVERAAEDAEFRKWDDPERILLVVAGGEAGRYSAVLGPCLGMESAVVSKEVRWTT